MDNSQVHLAKAPTTNPMLSRTSGLATQPQQTKWQKCRTCFYLNTNHQSSSSCALEGNLLCVIEDSSSSQATSVYLWITRMAALVCPQLEVPTQRHTRKSGMCSVIKQGLSSCVLQDWNSQPNFDLYPRNIFPEIFCVHLPGGSQGPLRAGQPCPTPLSNLARLNQKHSNPLTTGMKHPQDTSQSFSHVMSTPVSALACMVLHSCSQPCPKVWQALMGSQADAGGFLELGVCWSLAHW